MPVDEGSQLVEVASRSFWESRMKLRMTNRMKLRMTS